MEFEGISIFRSRYEMNMSLKNKRNLIELNEKKLVEEDAIIDNQEKAEEEECKAEEDKKKEECKSKEERRVLLNKWNTEEIVRK